MEEHMVSEFNAPNPVLFGIGTRKQVGEKLKRFGCTKVLLVYDPGIKAIGVADEINSYIEAAGIETVHYGNVQADPPDWSVNEAGELGIREKVDGVVGIGGGSSIDSAKAAKMLQTNPPPINQYFGREGVITKPSVPLIVIPTTAGTGSECTPGGVITDTTVHAKLNIAGVGCQVNLGIVDPELTVGLPPRSTAATGFDAFCHCAESFTSGRPNPYSGVVGKEGMRLVAKYLERAVKNGKEDIEAREGMMLAATLGGIAMSGALCHMSHDIGKSLGAAFGIAHGNACGACLPQVLQAVTPAVPDRVRFIAETFGAEVPEDATNEQLGEIICETMKAFMNRIDFPKLSGYGISLEEMLAVVPDGVMAQVNGAIKLFGGYGTSPIEVTPELIKDIVTRAYNEN